MAVKSIGREHEGLEQLGKNKHDLKSDGKSCWCDKCRCLWPIKYFETFKPECIAAIVR